ncbi:phage holin family protein [Nocardioides sp.]|uniref:phage holin family protein n=1 Tax=Nocardioides sp. TaxID=35761 RepID=UPI0035130200
MAIEPLHDEPTIGRLIKDAQSDISTLVRKEIQLAKAELKVSVSAGGVGIGLITVALYLFVLATIMLSLAFVYLINWNGDGLALQWAYLIIFGAYTLLAGLLVWLAIRSFKKVRAPERTIEQGKEIPKALRGKA